MPDEDKYNYTLEQETNMETNLDPQLQKSILKSRSKEKLNRAIHRLSPSGKGAIDVVAKLREPNREVPGLQVVRVIGDIVTGTVDIENIEAVRADPNVVSLKAARPLQPELMFSVPEIRASQAQLQTALGPGSSPINGAGIIVGIVDDGCDFVHRNFRKPDGSTRILFLWDQGSGEQTSISPPGFDYGREFGAAEINDALESADPFQHLAYDPGDEAHGTHVMDIAAGNGSATGNPGVAPQCDIVFVQVSTDDVPDEQSFGNSKQLLEAVDYIFEKAQLLGKPAVVNISLGTNGGPHDGSTPVEQGLDYLTETSGRAVVIAAGNSFSDRSHAAGTITPGQPRQLRLTIPASDFTENELEIWYPGSAILDVTLTDPLNTDMGPFPLGTTTTINHEGEKAGRVFHRQQDPNNGDNQIDILFGPKLPSGVWTVTLRVQGSTAVDFHAWVERDSKPLSRLSAADNDRSHTIGSISCGKNTIVVGSYDATVPARDLSSFSSAGPTRDGKQKPEVSAPGQDIKAARSRSQGSTRMQGTSMAAPHVTGLVALLMQAANNPLTIDQIRNSIIGTARRSPPPGSGWHPRYGFGRVDGAGTVLTQFAAPPGPLDLSMPSEGALSVPSEGALSVPFEGAEPVPDVQPELSLAGILRPIACAARASKSRVRIEVEVEPLIE